MLDGMERLQSRRRDDKTEPGILALVKYLHKEAEMRVSLRDLVEQRWIEDLQHFHGQYDDLTAKWLEGKKNRSSLFINITRPKTNAMVSRIIDLLFPTDDKHWGIQPTPVPEMGRRETQAQNIMDRFQGVAHNAQERFDDEDETDPAKLQEADEELQVANQNIQAAQDALDDLTDMRKEAKLACDLMEEEIYDQLKASSYQAQCRDVIEDACKLGSGVIKGPVLTEKVRKRWVQQDDGSHALVEVLDIKPGFVRVDPWSFFPDPNARTVEEGEGFYERHLMNRKQLRELARRSDMDKDAINNLLHLGPDDLAPNGMDQLFSLTNDESHQLKGKYQVWEYTGPVEPEQMALLADVYEDRETMDELSQSDMLTEIHAKVWFCQNEVLSFALHPLESNEPIYSVYNIEKSETYVLGGLGMPRIIRDPQKTINSAHRMMMDNACVSVGPQIVVNKERLTPENGSYELTEMKVWHDSDGISERPAFEIYNIPLNQALLANIIEMARRDVDEMSSMPMIAQGEQGAGVTKTAQGMAMLMNSANVNFRRYIRNWDDDITVPNLRRIYDFNMQFSDKDEIKGDYEVDARGSSVLLVREMQAANLMHLADRFGDHPEYGIYIDKPELLKQVVKANMLPADGLIRSEREAEELRQKAAKQPDPAMIAAQEMLKLKNDEIEARVAIASMNNDTKMKVEDVKHDGDMQIAAMNASEKAEDREAKMVVEESRDGDKARAAAISAESKERVTAADIGMAERTGKPSGGIA